MDGTERFFLIDKRRKVLVLLPEITSIAQLGEYNHGKKKFLVPDGYVAVRVHGKHRQNSSVPTMTMVGQVKVLREDQHDTTTTGNQRNNKGKLASSSLRFRFTILEGDKYYEDSNFPFTAFVERQNGDFYKNPTKAVGIAEPTLVKQSGLEELAFNSKVVQDRILAKYKKFIQLMLYSGVSIAQLNAPLSPLSLLASTATFRETGPVTKYPMQVLRDKGKERVKRQKPVNADKIPKHKSESAQQPSTTSSVDEKYVEPSSLACSLLQSILLRQQISTLAKQEKMEADKLQTPEEQYEEQQQREQSSVQRHHQEHPLLSINMLLKPTARYPKFHDFSCA